MLYQYINKYAFGYRKYFPISRDFSTDLSFFTPKIAFVLLSQLGIIANIVSKIMNYQYTKFHVFIKKLTIDVIFRWL